MWRRRIAWVGLGTLIAALIVIITLNLMPQAKQLDRSLGRLSPVDSAQFRREIGSLLGPTILDGNSVADFQNGAEIFPAMLAAIRSAQHSVDMETYIYDSGQITGQFDAALIERARAGVAVHLLADWAGSHESSDRIDKLRAAGVHFEYFHPLRWYDLNRLNNRTHRKLLIVDGEVAFTGGTDVADAWGGHGDKPQLWRDMQFRITGPGAAQVQAVFEDNWITVTGGALLGPDYYPPLRPEGGIPVQTIASSPEGGSENIRMLYLMAIDGARTSIDLQAAYFVPDALSLNALRRALKRGVKIRLIVPGPYVDTRIVRAASEATWDTMLQAGAKVYRFQPAMLHSKLMIVDGYLTIVGSANFDNRSFTLNDESNTIIYDHAFAAHMADVVTRDIGESEELNLQQWRARPWTAKFKAWFFSLIAEQL
jgi:cardiolipin synthase